MLDCDLADIYQVETRTFNQTVKRNIDRFPKEFMFKLTEKEFIGLRIKVNMSSQNVMTYKRPIKSPPYVFTEQGVMMLSGLLKSKVAVEVNIKVVNAFVEMRKYISSNLFDVSKAISNLDDRVKVLEDGFNKCDATGIYYEGSIYDAYSKIIDIFKRAKKSLTIIDNYIDNDSLDIISKFPNIIINIITNKDTCYIKDIDIDKYNLEYKNLKVIYNKSFRDRFFIIDEKELYHCGASINRVGYKTFAINKLEDNVVCDTFMSHVKRIIECK